MAVVITTVLFVLAQLMFSSNATEATFEISPHHDATMIPGAEGTDVVDACIQKITQQNVFPYDQQLLRRILFAESGYIDTNINVGGLWQLSPWRLAMTKLLISHELLEEIQLFYGIKWSSVEMEDLAAPFYSALAARIFIEVKKIDIPLSSDLEKQGEFWSTQYTTKLKTKKYFIDSVNFMSSRRGKLIIVLSSKVN